MGKLLVINKKNEDITAFVRIEASVFGISIFDKAGEDITADVKLMLDSDWKADIEWRRRTEKYKKEWEAERKKAIKSNQTNDDWSGCQGNCDFEPQPNLIGWI